MKRSRGQQALRGFKNEGRVEEEEAGVCNQERHRAKPTDQGKGGPAGYTDYSDRPAGTRGVQTGDHPPPPPSPPPPALDLSEM